MAGFGYTTIVFIVVGASGVGSSSRQFTVMVFDFAPLVSQVLEAFTVILPDAAECPNVTAILGTVVVRLGAVHPGGMVQI